ncbi:MAG: response regulator transcription factor [Methylophilaceae bacterium]|nr:response regulator transcription factor [Methylophilaceae bacterium]
MTVKTIKIALVDDHDILREGLKQILNRSENIEVVAEGGSAADAVSLCNQYKIDVLLLDISLPDRNGIEALKSIKERHHDLAVLILSSHVESLYALRAFKAGASGYLTKNSASSELVNAITQIAKGKKYITAEVAEVLVNQVDNNSEKPLHEGLSDREFQTLTLIASGFSVSEIAVKLSLSVKTISMYRSRLLDKMQMRHNTELINYAIKNKLVD